MNGKLWEKYYAKLWLVENRYIWDIYITPELPRVEDYGKLSLVENR